MTQRVEFNIADCSRRWPTPCPTGWRSSCGRRRLTYAELDERANRLAHGLAELGIGAGDHVGCYLHNRRRAPRDDARGVQAARGPDQRELPVRRRRARVPLRRRRARRRSSTAPSSLATRASRRVRRCARSSRCARRPRRTRPPHADGDRRLRGVVAPGRRRATSARARPTTTTSSTRAARPGARRAWCGGRRTSSSPRSAAGTPAARRSSGPRTSRARSSRTAPSGSARSSRRRPGRRAVRRRSGSVRSCTRAGSGRRSARCSAAARACSTRPRHLDLGAVCSTRSNASASSRSTSSATRTRDPLRRARRDAPGRVRPSSLLPLRLGRQHALGRREGRAPGRAARPCSAILEGLGSSESPVQGVAITHRVRRAGAALAHVRGERDTTVVLDDDLRPVAPGSGVVGRVATTGRIPLGYYNDPEKTAATFVEIDGRRCVAARRHGDGRRRRHVATARPRLAVHQHRRREGVPRGGRGGAEGAPRGRRRGRRRRARRALRRARRRGRRSRRRRRRAHARRAPGPLPRPRRRLQGAARSSCSSTRCSGARPGKPDYRWAKAVALGE